MLTVYPAVSWTPRVRTHEFYVSAISPVSVDGFSPNFCHWCISGQRWPDYVFGSKGQSSRSCTIAAEAHSTRRYRRVQLFLVFMLVGV